MSDDTARTSEERLLALEAIEDLKRLKARYFRSLDRKEWDVWGDVWAVDAVLEVPEAELVERGRDAIVASVSGALEGTVTVHHGHTVELELTGPDTATGTWAMADHVVWTAPDGGEPFGIRGAGHYEEEYRREDGTWRIARSRLVRLRVDPA